MIHNRVAFFVPGRLSVPFLICDKAGGIKGWQGCVLSDNLLVEGFSLTMIKI